MNFKFPTFSIIVPTYNRAERIKLLIKSLLKINYPKENFEIIIVNDGSKDNTLEILEPFSNDLKVYTIKNSERGFARNYGASKSKNQYLNFFDSDDICLPNHLISAASTIINYDFPEFIAQGYQLKRDNGEIIFSTKWELNRTLNKFLYKNILGCDGVFIRSDVAKKNKFIEDRVFAGSEDWILWFKIAHKYPIYASPPITHYGIEHNNRSVNNLTIGQIENKIEKLISIISNFKGHSKKIDLRNKSIRYLNIELSQYLTSSNHIKKKIIGIFRSSKSFWSSPGISFLKLYILCITNFFCITKSRTVRD